MLNIARFTQICAEKGGRKTKLKATTGILITLLLASTLGIVTPTVSANDQADWTFMVYMDADNNLYDWAYENLDLMDNVGSTDDVNVVVLWDGYYRPAYLYKVVLGGIELIGEFPLNGTEVNMGDPETLEAFVDFVNETFTADHYFLDLWDHGNSFAGGCVDDHTGVVGLPRDRLYNDEIAMALQGYHIDIIAWDACLMAMMEVAYEYVALGVDSDYLVGSENYVPLYGYPYDVILQALVDTPTMSELDFAVTVASEYAEYYRPRAHFNGGVMATLSVIDLPTIEEAAADLSALAALLKTKLGENFNLYRALISQARGDGNLPWSEYGWEYYIDLPTFTLSLYDRASDEDVKELAGRVSDTLINKTVVYVGNTQPMKSVSALGIGIWFPPSFHSTGNANQPTRVLQHYNALEFASTGWLNFLYTYWNDYGRGGGKHRHR